MTTVSSSAELQFKLIQGHTVATKAYATYPTKFIIPKKLAPSSCSCCWVFIIGYGGGILCHDQIIVKCCLEPKTIAVLTTQSSTKVYKRRIGQEDSSHCSQILNCTVANDSFLSILPHPVTCFKNSKYRQVQDIRLEKNGSLVLCDWITSGRKERGEIWEFDYFESRNIVYVDDELVFFDPLVLQDAEQGTIKDRMQNFHDIGMVVLIGSKVASLVSNLLAVESMKRKKFDSISSPFSMDGARNPSYRNRVLSSISPLVGHGAILRFATECTDDAYLLLRETLLPLSNVLGVCPYASNIS